MAVWGSELSYCMHIMKAESAQEAITASLRMSLSVQVVPVAAYDGRFDVWNISTPLSEGCDGPELPEEVML